jgi:beta-glucosidase
LVLAPAALAQPAASVCAEFQPSQPPPRDAVPAALENDDWRLHNEALLGRLQANTAQSPDIVFLGDSITEGWDKGLYAHFFGGWTTLNLGVSSDLTQSMLWRLDHGEWGQLRPRVVVLMIGTNNLTANSQPADVAVGVGEIVRFIKARSPQSRILLVGLLPRGQFAAEAQRGVVAQVNTRLRRCADGMGLVYLDSWPALLDHAGTMSFQISPDTLHLSPVGYALFGGALVPALRRLLAPR